MGGWARMNVRKERERAKNKWFSIFWRRFMCAKNKLSVHSLDASMKLQEARSIQQIA